MLEPSKPVTLKMRYTPYPAVELQSDEGQILRPGSVILRHRHLRQQFSVIPSTSRQRPHMVARARSTYQPAVPSPTVAATGAFPLAAAAPSVAGLPTPTAAGSSVPGPPAAAATATAFPSTVICPAASVSAASSPAAAGSSVVSLPVTVVAGDNLSHGIPIVAAPSAALALSAPVIALGENSPTVHGVSPMQALPVQATRRDTSRSHEIVETSDIGLVVKRGQHAIRDKKGKTTWFYSDGQTYLLVPPLIPKAQLGDLYVHTAANRDQQIWIFNRTSQWEKIQLYHPHPELSGYILHLLSDGEPRWIHKTTLTTYRGRDKRYKQMSSQAKVEVPPTSSGQAARLASTS